LAESCKLCVRPGKTRTGRRASNGRAALGHGRPECRSRHCDRRRSYVAPQGDPERRGIAEMDGPGDGIDVRSYINGDSASNPVEHLEHEH
jgi:hypothetical protein